jgi:hypothetical protein
VTSQHEGWSFATARKPALFATAIHPPTPDVQHAYDGEESLCGISEVQLEVYRHLFAPEDTSACPICRQRAAAAPTQPCGQERLHDRVLAAAAGPIRAELLDALQRGADIRLWINGPAADLAKHYGRLDQIVEGRPAVVAALDGDASVGLARVEDGPWQFIVVLPDHGPPLIARATADR